MFTHTHTHTHTNTHTYTYIYIYMYIHTHVCTYNVTLFVRVKRAYVRRVNNHTALIFSNPLNCTLS